MERKAVAGWAQYQGGGIIADDGPEHPGGKDQWPCVIVPREVWEQVREALDRAHRAECATADDRTGECGGCYASAALKAMEVGDG